MLSFSIQILMTSVKKCTFRFSNPFFYGPLLDANLNAKLPKPLLPPGTESTDKDYIPWGAYLLNKLTVYTEEADWQNLYKSLPEWMINKYMRPKFKGIDDWATSNKVLTDGRDVRNLPVGL